MNRFNDHLRLFKWLLLFAGLHQRTSRTYRWFLRGVLWSCAGLCVTNLFLQTRSYRCAPLLLLLSAPLSPLRPGRLTRSLGCCWWRRNTLFDVVLVSPPRSC